MNAKHLPIAGCRASDDKLASVTVPAIDIGGTDPIHPTEVARKLHTLLPNSRYHDPVATPEEWSKLDNIVPFPQVSDFQGGRIAPGLAGIYQANGKLNDATNPASARLALDCCALTLLRIAAIKALLHSMYRIPDWRTLDYIARRRRQSAAREQARALNPILNAFVELSPSAAPPLGGGRFGGLTYAAKDMFQTPSHRPGCGFSDSRALDIAGESVLLERFDAAGADFIGFTNMTELAYEPSGFNATRGRVRNPWNLGYISGGSSSGSAAAVASGAVVAALGSDTGGSLRIPAHACGVTAWKPSYGLVSVQGAMPLAPTLDSVGLLARSAEDMMLLVSLLADLPASTGATRAAVLQDAVAECEPAVRRMIADAVAALSGAGVAIERRAALAAVEAIDRHAMIVMQGESARVHRARLEDAALAPALRRRLSKGLEITDVALAESIEARARLVRDFEEQVLAANDLAVLPVMAIPTPSASECDPSSDRFSSKTLYALSRFTRFVNMLGFPAVALPVGLDHRGMPVGVQFVGRAGADIALLELVRHVQSMTDWHGRVPTAVAHLIPDLKLMS